MGDDNGPTATATKRRCNDAVASRDDSVWMRRDTDAPSESGDARVFPAVADYDPTGVRRPRSAALRDPNTSSMWSNKLNFNNTILT